MLGKGGARAGGSDQLSGGQGAATSDLHIYDSWPSDRHGQRPSHFLTADALAVVPRCKPEKVYRLAASGALPSCKVEGRRLFEQDEVARWLEGRRIAGHGDRP